MGAEAHGPKATKSDNSIKGEVVGGSYETSGKSKLGVGVSSSGSGQLLTGELKKNFSGELSVERDEEGKLKSIDVFDASISAKGSGASGKAEASYGVAKIDGQADILTGEVKAGGKVKIVEDGKFAPQVAVEAKASADIAKGSLNGTIGTDQYNVHGTAKGEFGHAEAKAGAGLGKITYEDENGNVQTGYGAYAEAGAEAYLAKGSLGGGITLFGVKIGASVDFKAGGAGATAGGEVQTGGLKGSLGLGLGVGLGVNISVDWSNFKWPEFKWPGSGKDKKNDSKKKTSTSGGGAGPVKIYVYPNALRGSAQELRSSSKEIQDISTQVTQVRDNLNLKGATAIVYKQRLNNVISQLKDEKKKTVKLAEALEEISQKYKDTESTIVAR